MFGMPLHPQLVHFPVALLILAAGFYVVAIWKEGFRMPALVTHLAGVAAAVAAILSGDAEEHKAEQFHDLLEWHERLGMASAWLFGLLGVWAFLRVAKAGRVERVLFILVYLAAVGVLTYGAHLGGEMVYLHGVGVETPS